MKTVAEKSDTELKNDVLAELQYEPSVSVADIGVLVQDGAVTLNGFVTSYGEKSHAVSATKRVAGVRAIAAITFSLYLCHLMAWQAVKAFLPRWVEHRGTQSFFLFMAAAFLVATLLYFLVEKPFLLLRDRLDGRVDKRS